jgi:CPA1 family monovalent cation:H+ antiporter
VDLFTLFSILTALAAVFSWINIRYIRLPTTIGLMIIALVFSIGLITIGRLGWGPHELLASVLEAVDFDEALLHGMLGAMLFAGALHVDLNDLSEQGGIISLLASVGLLLSTFIVGGLTFFLFQQIGFEIPFRYCLLFGALISPTDPIAVLGILKHVGVPKSLEIKIAGEALFNDGVAVVLFLVLLSLVTGEHEPTAAGVFRLLGEEVLGGITFGLVIGWVSYRMLKSIDHYHIEILITLAIVTAGYSAAQEIHTSGPLAMVVAGLLIGNHGRRLAMSKQTRERLDDFWELVDELLNALLFMLIGLEILVLPFDWRYAIAGALAIPVVIGARWVSVGLHIAGLRGRRSFSPHAAKILTWGGIRGGISVALALSLPPSAERDLLVTTTYVIVAFSIIVQGLSLGPLVRRLYRA